MSKTIGEMGTHMFPNDDADDGHVGFDKTSQQLQRRPHIVTHRGEDSDLGR